MSLGSLTARGLIGPLFVGHGAQKLFGAFGGPGLDETGKTFEQLGLRPGRHHAMAAGAAEAAGGALLTAGAATPLAGALLTGTMATAIRKVHGANGPWITNQGWEYNAVLIAAIAALVDRGPGRPSLDARVLPGLKGPAWALASIGAGVAGSYAVDRVAALLAQRSEDDAPPEAAAPAGADRAGRFAREAAARPQG